MEVLKSERLEGGVQRVSINRPQSMNAIDGEVERLFKAAMASASDDPGVRAVIITGEGPHFSAGGDLPFLQSMGAEELRGYHRGALALVRAIALCPKPTIASVRGACAGGAFGFALACDYLLASETAYFSAQFLRIGLVPDMGVVYFAAHRIGGHRARKFLLDNKTVKAEEAAAIGLCDTLHADDALDEETLRLASRLALLPPRAVRQTKWLTREAEGNFKLFLGSEIEAVADCLGGEEFLEGTAAFFEKRSPRFI